MTDVPSIEKQLSCGGSVEPREFVRGREDARLLGTPLASSPMAATDPLTLPDLRCLDRELVLGDPGGFVAPGRVGAPTNTEGDGFERFGSGSLVPMPVDERPRFVALLEPFRDAVRFAASIACSCATVAVAKTLGAEDVTMDDATMTGAAFFWLGELRARADFAFGRDFGVGGSADDAVLWFPRGAVMMLKLLLRVKNR